MTTCLLVIIGFLAVCQLGAYSKLIVIDPGHGGSDNGYTGVDGKTREKDLNLQIAIRIRIALQRMGHRVLLTRTIDIYVSDKTRVWRANEWKAHLFITVHFNRASSSVVWGVEVHYYRAGKTWAWDCVSELAKATGAKNLGRKYNSRYVLVKTSMPAIMVIPGYLSNAKELGKVKSVSYQDKIARGVANGVKRYLH